MPIEVPIRGSWRLVVLLALVLLATLAAIWLTRLPTASRVVLTLAVVGYGGLAIHSVLRPAWQRIRLAGHSIELFHRGGRRLRGRLQGAAFVTPVYIGFRVRPDSRRLPVSVGVFRDQAPLDSFRRLAVGFRHPEPGAPT